MSPVRRIPITILGCALALSVLASAATAATLVVDDDGVQCPGAQHATINGAVAAASNGDTIQVCAGTYPELVHVNKDLTFLGAQSGVDARGTRTGLPATESVVTGSAGSTSFYVTVDNVTIDGFTVQGATNPNQFGAGIVLAPNVSGTEIVNNILQDSLNGLFLSNGGGGSALVQHNVFRNNNAPGAASGHGIYADEFTAGHLRNVLIRENDFIANDSAGIGISVTDPTRPATNLAIEANHFDGNGNAIYMFHTVDSTITGNLMENQTASTIGILGGVRNLDILQNTLRNGATRGIRMGDFIGAVNEDVQIHENSITPFPGGPGLEIDPGSHVGTVNAECNWWGSSSGPNHASNPTGTGEEVIGDADIDPWLVTPPGPGSSCGLPASQGDCVSSRIRQNCEGLRGRARSECIRQQQAQCAAIFGRRFGGGM